MAYDPYTKTALRQLHKKFQDMAEALRKMIEMMEEKGLESVDLQLREVKKRVSIYVDNAVEHLNTTAKKLDDRVPEAQKYVKSKRK